jgi:tRNA (mo5U34)-methyltransferase
MTTSEVKLDIEKLEPWFHNLHLPDGTQTCPGHALGDFPTVKWRQIAPHLPPDLNGWTALDIGCNAGFYSFELARRGAHVTALDVDDHYLAQARWAAAQYGLGQRIAFCHEHVYQLAHTDRSWDIVLFMGVFYHLRYPLLGLDIVSRRVKKLLVFQTMTMPGDEVEVAPVDLGLEERERLTRPGWPKVAFIERDLASDCTNWWAPNHACVEAMLRSTGMRVVARPGHEIYLCEPDAATPSNMWLWNEEEYRAATRTTKPAGSNGKPNGEQR